MSTWDQIYKNGVAQLQPSEQIIKLEPLFRREGVNIILDHGCGSGRHANYFATKGYFVFGTEPSEDAIKLAYQTGAKGNVLFIKTDMDRVPSPDNYFDATISNHVVQHALQEMREGAFQEIERTLKSGGLLFLRTPSRKHKAYGTGIQIEPHTYIDIPNLPDGKTPHHYFSDDELKEKLINFEILELEHHSLPATKFFKLGLEEWAVLARKK